MTIGDSEIKVMQILWNTPEQALQAKEISSIANKMYNWNKNTTYTLIKRCIQKQAISREDPNFICHALITKEEIQAQEVENLPINYLTVPVNCCFLHFLAIRDFQTTKLKL